MCSQSSKSACSLAVRSPGSGLGPVGEQGAIEPLDLATGRRSVGLGEGVCCVPERGVEVATSVAAAVVGEHTCDGDVMRGEERFGSLPERGGGCAVFVAEHFAVLEAVVAVDRSVH